MSLTASSEKTYRSLLAGLYKRINANNLTIHTLDSTPVIASITQSPYKDATKATLFAALYDETHIAAYREAMQHYSARIKEQYAQQVSVQRGRSFADLCSIHNAMLPEAYTNEHTLQLALLTGLASGAYDGFPPRRLLDLAELKFTSYDEASDNCLLPDNTLLFNRYKTAKHYGAQRVPMPEPLVPIARELIARYERGLVPKGGYVFCNCKKEKYSVSLLSKKLTSVFGCSVDKLRSAYLSHMYKDTPPLKKMEETATNMGHSVNAALLFYVKQD